MRKNKFIKTLCCLTAAACVAGCSACGGSGGENGGSDIDGVLRWGQNYRAELTQADQSYIYGMDYLAYERLGSVDYKKAFQTAYNLGVKSIRQWMHFGYFMSDGETLIKENCDKMHDILSAASAYGFQMIGMNHMNWSVKYKSFVVGKPRVQSFANSDYKKWLETYEQSWYLTVKEFPEITIWEIDNELNNHDFMYYQGEKTFLSNEEMAKIAADMLFYGSRGIHRANPMAVTVLGGLVDPCGLGIATPENGVTMANFLEKLYDEIDSGTHGSYHADDFFQCAAWHPYYYTTVPDEYFWNENDKVYEVIKRREGKDKKVFFTELGWDEKAQTDGNTDRISEAIETLFRDIKTKLPYVESVHYYMMFDNAIDNMNTAGLFYDPDKTVRDVFGGVVRTPGAPKPWAYAYQKAAGGSGSLELMK